MRFWLSPLLEAALSELQALPEVLVYQNFDIHVPIELTVIGVFVADSRMGSPISDRTRRQRLRSTDYGHSTS